MKLLKTILKPVKLVVATVMLISIIGFVNMKQTNRYVEHVAVNIDNSFQNYFIDENDVFELIDEAGKDYLLESDLGSLNLSKIEKKIENHRFVKDADVYRDLNGNLTIDVEQNRPMARVISEEGSDQYIGTTGLMLPQSSHFTARVLLITASEDLYLPESNIKDEENGQKLFELLEFINKDEFWKAQIAGVHIGKDYEMLLQPQVTKQLIEFGKADQIEEKFKKLKIFYKEILPYEGWNSYESVNLKYKNQIVCK